MNYTSRRSREGGERKGEQDKPLTGFMGEDFRHPLLSEFKSAHSNPSACHIDKLTQLVNSLRARLAEVERDKCSKCGHIAWVPVNDDRKRFCQVCEAFEIIKCLEDSAKENTDYINGQCGTKNLEDRRAVRIVVDDRDRLRAEIAALREKEGPSSDFSGWIPSIIKALFPDYPADYDYDLESIISAINRQRETLKLLQREKATERHIHVNNGLNDACKVCGRDLRDDIHLRSHESLREQLGKGEG